MAEYHIPNNLRMSSTGFLWGQLVHTTYKSACLRKILLQSKGIQAPVKSKYRSVGTLNEDRHAKSLEKSGRVFKREVEFSRPVAAQPEITTTGHCDFVLTDTSGCTNLRVDELKSITSANVRRIVLRDGNYSVENLAQTVRYMIEARVPRGRLIYTFWKWDKKTSEYEPEEERVFEIEIDDYGRIHVDEEPSMFTVQDLVAFENAAAEVIKRGVVWPTRPFRAEIPFVGCCNYCPFRTACDAYDSGTIGGSDAFVELAKLSCEEETENGE